MMAWLLLALISWSFDDQPLRRWADSSGKFEVLAKLIAVTDTEVTLEREDGKRIQVPIDRLSAADQGFLARQKPGDPDKPSEPAATVDRESPQGESRAEGEGDSSSRDGRYAELARLRYVLYDARDWEALHVRFLARQDLTDEERTKAERGMSTARRNAQRGLRRFGGDWLTPEQAADTRRLGEKFANEASRIAGSTSPGETLETLEKSGDLDKTRPDAVYELAALWLLYGRNAERAAPFFRACVQRLEGDAACGDPVATVNLAACLNNLAIAEARTSKTTDAVRHWLEALELVPQSATVRHNLCHLRVLVEGQGLITSSKSLRENLDQVLISNAISVKDYWQGNGWQVMPLYKQGDPASKDAAAAKAAREVMLEPAHELYGIVVSDDVVVAPHTPVPLDLSIELTDATGRTTTARRFSSDPELGVDFYRLAESIFPPLPLAEKLDAAAPLSLTDAFRENGVGIGGQAMLGTQDGSVLDFIVIRRDSPRTGRSGPVLDSQGRCVAVPVSRAWDPEDRNAGAYLSVERLRERLAKLDIQLPEDVAQPAAGDAWKSSMVRMNPHVEARPAAGAELARSQYRTEGWNDPWCLTCKGTQLVPCYAPKCTGGVILTPEQYEAGRNATGVIYRTRNRRDPCPACDGSNRLRCPAPSCRDGIQMIDPSWVGRLPAEPGINR